MDYRLLVGRDVCGSIWMQNFHQTGIKLYLNAKLNSVSEMLENISKCQRDINSVVSTAESWGIILNSDKCVVLRFQLGNRDWEALGLYSVCYLHNSRIKDIQTHTDLGVAIDTSLKFHDHNRSISGTSNSLPSN